MYAIKLGDKYFSSFHWERKIKLSKNPNFYEDLAQAKTVFDMMVAALKEGLAHAQDQLAERQRILDRVHEDIAAVDREISLLEQQPYREVCDLVPPKETLFKELSRDLRLYEELIKDSGRDVARYEKLVALKPQIMVFPNRPLSTVDTFDMMKV